MKLFDSHAHLDRFDERGELDAVLTRAQQAGVERMVAIGGTPEANARACRLATDFPDRIVASVGLDRDEAGTPVDRETLLNQLARPGVVAVGETGLDYHYGADRQTEQQSLFEAMLDLSRETGRPAVVHSREADEDTLSRLSILARSWSGGSAGIGVLHCFTGSYDFARRLLDLGLMISFSGIVTFKRSEALRDVASRIPLDRMLIETDAPYLAPVPHRGKENEPAWVGRVAEVIAECTGRSADVVAGSTFENAQRLFGLAGKEGSS